MATVKNLVIDQGSHFSVTVVITDALENPLNLTGYTVRSQLRKSYGSNTYTAITMVISSAQEGEITMSLTNTQTSALRSGRYVYDVEIVSPGNVVTRVLEGIITVTPEVTR